MSLLAAATDAAWARGLWPILDVASHFHAAMRLYESCGWTRAGRITVDFHGAEPLDEFVYLGPGARRAMTPSADIVGRPSSACRTRCGEGYLRWQAEAYDERWTGADRTEDEWEQHGKHLASRLAAETGQPIEYVP